MFLTVLSADDDIVNHVEDMSGASLEKTETEICYYFKKPNIFDPNQVKISGFFIYLREYGEETNTALGKYVNDSRFEKQNLSPYPLRSLSSGDWIKGCRVKNMFDFSHQGTHHRIFNILFLKAVPTNPEDESQVTFWPMLIRGGIIRTLDISRASGGNDISEVDLYGTRGTPNTFVKITTSLIVNCVPKGYRKTDEVEMGWYMSSVSTERSKVDQEEKIEVKKQEHFLPTDLGSIIISYDSDKGYVVSLPESKDSYLPSQDKVLGYGKTVMVHRIKRLKPIIQSNSPKKDA